MNVMGTHPRPSRVGTSSIHTAPSSHLCKAQRRSCSVGYEVKFWCVAFLGVNVIHWLVTKALLPMTYRPQEMI